MLLLCAASPEPRAQRKAMIRISGENAATRIQPTASRPFSLVRTESASLMSLAFNGAEFDDLVHKLMTMLGISAVKLQIQNNVVHV